MKLQRYDVWADHDEDYGVTLDYREKDSGRWCQSRDVGKLEANIDEAIRLLIEARHVCAYPDMNTGLLAEIDTLLKKMGKTNLPELY